MHLCTEYLLPFDYDYDLTLFTENIGVYTATTLDFLFAAMISFLFAC